MRRFLLALTLTAIASLAHATDRGPVVAFTFDDLPAHAPLPPGSDRVRVAKDLVAALDAAKAPAFGFINGVQTLREPASTGALDVWRASGRPLGNHTWTHLNLAGATPEAFETEIVQNQSMLQALMGQDDWRWLRYPYLSEGDTPQKRLAVRGWLAQHGYKIASVTLSFGDYAFNEPYARCAAQGDTAAIARLETDYLDFAAKDADRARAMAKTLYGHDIPYVLLMHAGAFDARMLPRLVDLYKARGFGFTTLAKAEADPFYRTDLDPSLPPQPTTLDDAMRAKGLTPPASGFDLGALNGVCR